MAKKKKKKKPSGATRSTYAKGKKIEEKPAKGAKTGTGAKGAAGAAATPAGKGATAKGKTTEPERQSWNLVKRGSLEMKVFMVIAAVIILCTFLQYPAFQSVTSVQYAKLQKEYTRLEAEYKTKSEEFKAKYPTPEAQSTNAKEQPAAPAKPKKPTGGDFVLLRALLLILQSMIFAFLGLNIIRRTDLGTPVLDESLEEGPGSVDWADFALWGAVGAVAALVPLVASTFVIKTMGMVDLSKTSVIITQGAKPEVLNVSVDAWRVSMFSIGFVAQYIAMLLMLVFAALVWVFMKYRDKTKVEPHWAALVAGTVLGGAYFYYILRSMASELALKQSPAVLVGTAALFSVSMVAVLGYLFWRKGLEYSLLAGIVSFGAFPFIASVIIK